MDSSLLDLRDTLEAMNKIDFNEHTAAAMAVAGLGWFPRPHSTPMDPHLFPSRPASKTGAGYRSKNSRKRKRYSDMGRMTQLVVAEGVRVTCFLACMY